MTILERKIRLDGSQSDFTCDRLVIEPGRRAVLRYRLVEDWLIGGSDLVVPEGTTTISHYWTDRPYNVYHWVLPGGRTLAVYCNVVDRTTIDDDAVTYEDLAVDVLIMPDGVVTVLDEEELPPDLSPARRGIVARALEAVTASPIRLTREIEAASRLYL